MNENHYPQALWSEILPGLWQGGTHDDDTTRSDRAPRQYPAKEEFDSVFTHYGPANPTGYAIKEIRYPFADGDMTDLKPEEDLWLPVAEAHADWKAGKRVLIRCQAGLNRSGLVMALTLIREGYTPQDAIDLMRRQRGPDAMCNRTFEQWLLNDADLEFWRGRMAA